MKSSSSLESIRSLASPFPGRTFISVYAPKAPIDLITNQLQSELKQTENSTNWKVKGAVIMMLKQLVNYIENLEDDVPKSGIAIFVVPKDEKTAIIHHILPEKEFIDLFFYVLDERFYIKEEHFSFT